MKKAYIQPTTQQIQLNGEPLCDEQLLVGSNGNPVEGKMGAPGRIYNPVLSLKDL